MIHLRTPLNLALLAIGVLATLAGYLLVPAGTMLPVRWGLDLQPTQLLPRNIALLQLPGAVALVWLLLWLAARYGNKARQARQVRALNIILPALTGVLVAVQVAMVIVGMRAVPV